MKKFLLNERTAREIPGWQLWEELKKSDSGRVYRTYVVVHESPEWAGEGEWPCELITTNEKLHLRLGRLSASAQVILCVLLKRNLFSVGVRTPTEHLQVTCENNNADTPSSFSFLVTATNTREGLSFQLSPA